MSKKLNASPEIPVLTGSYDQTKIAAEKIEIEKICKKQHELLESRAFKRVLGLYNKKHPRSGIKKIEDIVNAARTNDFGEPLFAGLHEYWMNELQPRLQQHELNNAQHAEINKLVLQVFAGLVKKLGGSVAYSAKRLPAFEAIAQDLLSSGYMPLIFRKGGHPYGEPVYPNEQNTCPEDGYIKVVPLPVMEDRSKIALNNPILPNPRMEISSFIKPADPKKVHQLAEQDALGFSHEAGICSHMSVTVCRPGKNESDDGWLEPVCVPNARFASHPLEQMRQYGSGLFEGIGVEKDENGKINIFRLKDHWKRMTLGGQYFRMPPIPFEVFEKMVMETVAANHAYIPAAGKGRLYIRPNWFDCGPKMHVGNSGNFMLLMVAVPIGSAMSYYKKKPADKNPEQKDEGMTLFFPRNAYRAVENGPGQIKADGNYGATIPHIEAAAKNNMQGVMYRNEGGDRIEETNASSLIFLQVLPGQKTAEGKQKYCLLTPSLKHGTILDSVTRSTILELAGHELGWDVKVKDIHPEELIELAEAGNSGGIVAMFSAGTGAVLTPIHHIHDGWLKMDDGINERGEPVRSFDINKKEGRILGRKISIGRYDEKNPYGAAGRDLLQALLDAKNGRLQARRPENETYRGWLTRVDPLAKK